MNPQTILFFGPSGTGKGTQVELLMKHIAEKDATHPIIKIEMGALLRGMVAAQSYSGNLTNEIISKGGIMPSFMPVYLMTRQMVETFTGTEHIVADGVVRQPDQARGFDDMMQFYNRADYQIVFLDLAPEIIMERLMARGRNDDTEEAIRNRLGWYKTTVEPLIDILKERGRTVHYINGEPSVPEVHQAILSALKLA